MATTTKPLYGSSTAITITLASLASGSARESAAVDNTSNLYLDAMVSLIIPVASGTLAGDKCIYIYVAGSEDGTNYTNNATGSDAAITLTAPYNVRLVTVLNVPTAGVTYNTGPFFIAPVFGGVLPKKWSLIVLNSTGVALGTSGFTVEYSGVQTQSV